MTRPILLSNGSLHVGINLYGMVHDFYYPYVGLENHATAQNMRHRIGVWTEGQFSWLDDGNWQFDINYEEHALIGHITAHNETLNVTLEFSDCVDSEYNAFLRNIHVVNSADRHREIRLFLHQVFLISNSLTGDTAQYLPGEPAILHYKGHRAFVVSAQDAQERSFDQYSIGVFGIEGKDGTYRDAEDGNLAGNAVEHGKVDSVIGFTFPLDSLDSTRVNYWVVAAKQQSDAVELHRKIRAQGLHHRFQKTADHWHRWLRTAEKTIVTLPKELRKPFRKSLLVIKSHIDHRGAVIASTDTTMLNYWRDAYGYCWPRDAAYALWPLLRLGYKTELKKFFAFCRDGLQPDGFLMHKYQADGAPGSSWHPYMYAGRPEPPIQEDETALVVFLLGEYVKRTKDTTLEEFYPTLVVPAANFMASYIDEQTKLPHASYDLWEERFLTSTYTTAVVYAALNAAAKMAEQLHRPKDAVRWQTVADEIYTAAENIFFNHEKGYFYKGVVNRGGTEGLVFDDTIDVSSFYGAFMFGLFDPKSDIMQKAYQTLIDTFHLTDNEPTKLPRYEHDQYNTVDTAGLGNPWFVTSLWMAQRDLQMKREDRAKATVKWTTELMLPSGVLSEQINPFSQRFISVAPLAWSQAEFLNTVLDLVKREHESEKKA
ncbi:MAG: glycoside hydrolase family 15 protein [Candidatus Saccharimonadales bacterium]